MSNKIIGCVLVLGVLLAGSSYAKDTRMSVQDVVAKMAKEYNLTDVQAKAIEPIVKEAMLSRQAVYESIDGQMLVDREEVKAQMRKIQKDENQKLSKIFSEEQMKKMTDKQRMRERLNKDQIDFSEGVGSGGLSIDGASMQF